MKVLRLVISDVAAHTFRTSLPGVQKTQGQAYDAAPACVNHIYAYLSNYRGNFV
jgi:hypothetical protein